MVKNVKNLLLRNQKADDLETWYAALSPRVLRSLFKLCLLVDLDLFYGNVKFGHLYFCTEKGKPMDFSEPIGVYDLKLATDDRSDKKFLLTSTLCPLGAICPLPRGYKHVLNHEKKYKKSDLKEISLKLATNG